ncbi:DnaD domain protein [Lapidilactobacillus wuchangensis]|uniref:DnaD domain protein n=1 Tax=Lapidilactobacillus wuchangensis TaxID=2486001 RepID=UPI000F781E95|nr:DnaD domain protein [Lapidilactobacillus wuchangensis]
MKVNENKTISSNLDPQLGYFLARASIWTDQDQVVLTKLYQPLLSTAAYTMYLTLWSEVNDQQLVSQRQHHFQLFDLLDLDAGMFLTARRQLEALGLVRTYQKQDQLGTYLIYQLFTPLAPEKFFQEELLATFLLEQVSRPRFMALRAFFALPKVDLTATQELTAGFLDVFHVASTSLLVPPTEVQQSAHYFKNDQQKRAIGEISPAELASFDWETLIALVGRQQIEPTEINQHQSEIYGLKAFYDFTLTDIARLIARSIDRQTNKINFNLLEQKALAAYQQLHPSASEHQTNSVTTTAPTNAQTTGTTKQRLAPAEQQLIEQAQKMLPLDFLRWEKDRVHSYVGEQEIRNLKKLQQRGVFENATLNMLIHTILQDSTTLTVALLDKVAQDWLKHGVNSPTAALAYLQAQQNKPQRQYNRRGKTTANQTKGPVPSWLNNNGEDKKKNHQAAASSVTANDIRQKLARLEKTRQERDGRNA